uniref:X-ray repair complementing defective repair in Chinese hamster cells 5 n=1 Tax=Gadus morhua TaxID=8049 RepID=A0A8C5FK74_GADMO
MDVGSCMSSSDQEPPFEQAKKVVQKFVQRQVFAENKDELGLVLFGTETTNNQLDHDGQYQNITVHRKLMIPDFKLLEEIEHQIHPQSEQADWLDALVVSMDLIQKELPMKKYERLSIAILTDLNTQANPEQLDVIISNLTGAGITLQFFLPFQVLEEEEEEEEEGDEGGGDGVSGGAGRSGCVKGLSQEQQKGLEILKEVMFTLDEEDGLDQVYTFSGAIRKLSMFKNIEKRPMAWPCQLTIGSTVAIRIVGYKAVTDEKLKKMWTTVDAQSGQREDVKRETVYCLDDDNETEVQKDDTIQGFRYGSDIVPFSKVDQEQMKYKHDGKCFAVLGFVHRHQFMGNQAMKVFAPKDDEHAGVALSSLIRALDELKMVAIVRYTYDRRSNPQVGAAFPCIKRKYECLVYVQLPFMEDLRQFTFPSLENKKSKPSESQLSAVDSLIDSMMLVKEDEMGEEVDLFKVHHLPNPSFQRHFQCLHHRAVHPDSPLPSIEPWLQAALQRPLAVAACCQAPLEELKKSFPLKQVEKKKQLKTSSQIFGRGDMDVNVNKVVVLHSLCLCVSVSRPACQQLTHRIEQLLGNKKTAYYMKCITCVQAFREESVKVNKHSQVITRGQIPSWLKMPLLFL